MAKKTFNVKSTLAVQPKQFSVDDVETAIKQIHEAKAAPTVEKTIKTAKKPSVAKAAPLLATAPAPKSKEVEAAPVRKVRLSVDINPATHKKLKIKAIEHDSDITHYVEMLIERDLAK